LDAERAFCVVLVDNPSLLQAWIKTRTPTVAPQSDTGEVSDACAVIAALTSRESY
jgi:hypothetical protein